jgi:hypothetical protein
MAAMINYRPAGDSLPPGVMRGGLPPMRPDQANQPASRGGGGPTPQSDVVLARVVIIYGPGITGWFEYAGKPGPGNPPVTYDAPAGVTTDPYGNALPTTTGGVVSVNTSLPDFYTQLLAAVINFNEGSVEAPGSIGLNGSTILELRSPVQDAGGPVMVADLLSEIPGVAQLLLVQIAQGGVVPEPATTALLEVQGSIGLTNVVTLPAVRASAAQVSASAGFPVATCSDGNNYDMTRLTIATSSQASTTSPVAMTGISFALAADSTYHLRALIPFTTTAAAGTAEFTPVFAAGGVTGFQSAMWAAPGAAVDGPSRTTSPLTVLTSPTLASGTFFCWLDMMLITTSAGTLLFDMQQSTAGDGFTVVIGGYFELMPVAA